MNYESIMKMSIDTFIIIKRLMGFVGLCWSLCIGIQLDLVRSSVDEDTEEVAGGSSSSSSSSAGQSNVGECRRSRVIDNFLARGIIGEVATSEGGVEANGVDVESGGGCSIELDTGCIQYDGVCRLGIIARKLTNSDCI